MKAAWAASTALVASLIEADEPLQSFSELEGLSTGNDVSEMKSFPLMISGTVDQPVALSPELIVVYRWMRIAGKLLEFECWPRYVVYI
jgi:hypothetical protein